MRALILCLAGFALVQCSSPKAPPPAPPSPPPAPIARPAPPPTATNWEDLPAAPGDWSYRSDQRGSVALFGVSGADADFLVRCASDTRRLYVSRKGAFPTGETGRITLRASSGMQSYPLANSNAAPAYVSAELTATDRQLDALAFSRGRFLVSVKGAADLIVPAWPELARVIEDCRR